MCNKSPQTPPDNLLSKVLESQSFNFVPSPIKKVNKGVSGVVTPKNPMPPMINGFPLCLLKASNVAQIVYKARKDALASAILIRLSSFQTLLMLPR